MSEMEYVIYFSSYLAFQTVDNIPWISWDGPDTPPCRTRHPHILVLAPPTACCDISSVIFASSPIALKITEMLWTIYAFDMRLSATKPAGLKDGCRTSPGVWFPICNPEKIKTFLCLLGDCLTCSESFQTYWRCKAE